MEASWTAARETERLRVLGLEVVAGSGSGFQGLDTDAVVRSLERLEAALDEVSSVPTLAADAQAVNDAAYELADVIEGLSVNQNELLSANDLAAAYRLRMATTTSDIGESEAALSVLRQALQVEDEDALQELWEEFAKIYATGIDPAVASLGEGEGVFYVRGRQLALETSIRHLATSFDQLSVALENSVSGLLVASRSHSAEALDWPSAVSTRVGLC